jgi:intracellular sulfur oxidation DsrE/DsrF family protein
VREDFVLLLRRRKMNSKFLQIPFVAFVLVFTIGISVSQGSIQSRNKIAKNTSIDAREMFYRVSSSDLESMKNSLVQINLHMREKGHKNKPKIKIVIHGEGAKFFYAKGMDSELKYMVDWFLAEDVQFGICEICQEAFGVDFKAFPDGFMIIKNR